MLGALALGGAIIGYNWNHKGNRFSPLTMAACRLLAYVVAGLAAGLRAVARGLDALWGIPMPYVMTVHQGLAGEPGGHVRVVFAPARRAPDRLKFLAGCEQGAGTFLNDRLPEETAPELREAIARGA